MTLSPPLRQHSDNSSLPLPPPPHRSPVSRIPEASPRTMQYVRYQNLRPTYEYHWFPNVLQWFIGQILLTWANIWWNISCKRYWNIQQNRIPSNSFPKTCHLLPYSFHQMFLMSQIQQFSERDTSATHLCATYYEAWFLYVKEVTLNSSTQRRGSHLFDLERETHDQFILQWVLL